MDPDEQIASFESALDAMIVRYGQEYDVPIATLIGCLQIKVHELCAESIQLDKDASS